MSQGTLLAVTENNSAYGIDPVTGSVAWHHNYGTAFNPSVLACGDLSPKVGITGDAGDRPRDQHRYFTSKIATTADSSTSAWYMHAVNVATGVEQPGFPVLIHGTATNDPEHHVQRAVRDAAHRPRARERCRLRGLRRALRLPAVSRLGRRRVDRGRRSRACGPTRPIRTAAAAPASGSRARRRSSTRPVISSTSPATARRPPPVPRSVRPQPQGLGECVVKLNTTTTADRRQALDRRLVLPGERRGAERRSTATSAPAARPRFPRASSRRSRTSR